MTTVDTVAPGRARHRAPRQSGRAFAGIVRGVGELFITLGALLLLFCVYQLFYTNVPAKHAMAKETKNLQQQWKKQLTTPGAAPAPAARKHTFKPGEGFAIIYIPKLGKHYQKPIVEGVTLDDLAKGIGHYPKSAMPGQVGNFALAGHRATHGEPFAYLPRIRRGDPVVVETADAWYTYTVYDYKNHVSPTQTDVIAPVPGHQGRKPTEKLITLTTCNPRWASYERFIVWGKLTSVMKKTADVNALPPALRT